jgi:hypothetical protein
VALHAPPPLVFFLAPQLRAEMLFTLTTPPPPEPGRLSLTSSTSCVGGGEALLDDAPALRQCPSTPPSIPAFRRQSCRRAAPLPLSLNVVSTQSRHLSPPQLTFHAARPNRHVARALPHPRRFRRRSSFPTPPVTSPPPLYLYSVI